MIGRWDKIKCKENGAVEIKIKWSEEGDNDNDIHKGNNVIVQENSKVEEGKAGAQKEYKKVEEKRREEKSREEVI